jgi:hypothetical protein
LVAVVRVLQIALVLLLVVVQVVILQVGLLFPIQSPWELVELEQILLPLVRVETLQFMEWFLLAEVQVEHYLLAVLPLGQQELQPLLQHQLFLIQAHLLRLLTLLGMQAAVELQIQVQEM